jgi:cytochrome c oxidase cbb3-type subunit 3
MPSFGHDKILKPAEVQDVASYVRSLSGQEPRARRPSAAALFAANCVACHGPGRQGQPHVRRAQPDRPHLALWRQPHSVAETVTNAHAGVMPAWGQRLDPVTIKMLAAYVHSLGGGEAFAAPAAPEAAASTGQ